MSYFPILLDFDGLPCLVAGGGRLIWTSVPALRYEDGTDCEARFLKLFGLRVSLDETERILKTQYPGSDFVCIGNDRRMTIVTTAPTAVWSDASSVVALGPSPASRRQRSSRW